MLPEAYTWQDSLLIHKYTWKYHAKEAKNGPKHEGNSSVFERFFSKTEGYESGNRALPVEGLACEEQRESHRTYDSRHLVIVSSCKQASR
jgi:hypothetical protein